LQVRAEMARAIFGTMTSVRPPDFSHERFYPTQSVRADRRSRLPPTAIAHGRIEAEPACKVAENRGVLHGEHHSRFRVWISVFLLWVAVLVYQFHIKDRFVGFNDEG